MDKPISRAELARRLGVSLTYVTLLLQGKRIPSQLIANRLRQLALTTRLPEQEHLMDMVGLVLQ